MGVLLEQFVLTKNARLLATLLVASLACLALVLVDQQLFRPRRQDAQGGVRLHLSAPSCTSLQQNPAASACNVSRHYQPSHLEQLWLQHVEAWQHNFCNSLQPLDNSTLLWLDTLAELAGLQGQYMAADKSPAQVLAEQGKLDPRVFSHFTTTFDCGGPGKTTQQVTWIEPLSHGLRHPNALCNRGTDVMDRRYLLLAHNAEVVDARHRGKTQCVNRTCQSIFFDLGATTLKPGTEEAGQGWFYDAYWHQGITFDRFLLWEAVVRSPEEVYKHVPRQDMHKYQYYNIPVTTDATDAANPVNILKTIAQPGDFVVFKLDIDNYPVEHAVLDALSSDLQAFDLVDEFFFEEHVNFGEMLVHWGSSVGPNTSLASSYNTFYKLRQRGMRAHSWV